VLACMHVRNWPSSVSPHGLVVTVLQTWSEGHAPGSQRVKQPLLIFDSSPAGVNHSLPAAAQPPAGASAIGVG